MQAWIGAVSTYQQSTGAFQWHWHPLCKAEDPEADLDLLAHVDLGKPLSWCSWCSYSYSLLILILILILILSLFDNADTS